MPAVLPRLLPDDWKGGFVLLVLVFVLSSFLDNIAAAMIGGAMAHTVFTGKVHIGYLAAIVAASNAGGAGSVVGDTTTTMMWIAGISPLEVLEAFIASAVALVRLRHPGRAPAAALLADPEDDAAHAPRRLDARGDRGVHPAAAVVVNVVVNLRFNEMLGPVPVPRRRGVGGDPADARLRTPDWSLAAGRVQGLGVPAVAGAVRVDDAGRALACRVVADRARARLSVRGVRQHSADRARHQAGRLRLGLPRLRGRLRRLDDLVRLVGRRGAVEHVPEARSVGLWLRHGWHVAVAYVIGFFVMLAMIGFHPGALLKGSAGELSRYIIAPRLSSSCCSAKIEV